MKSRRSSIACGMAVVLGLCGMAVTQARADAPIEPFPITHPDYEPEYVGLGHEPGVQAAFNSPTLLFVNMDGGTMKSGCGNDSHNDCTTIGFLAGRTIEPFAPDDPARRNAVIQAVREDVEDFGVIVVGTRPPDNQPYAMVMVGTPQGVDVGNIGGIAPTIDCGNTNPNMTSFAFLTGSSNIIATVVHQEAAHTWGLEHVDDSTDNLYPTAGGTTNPKYNDSCSQIVSNTDLNPTLGQCGQVHSMFCPTGQQNSYREMLLLFGPPVPDNVPPTVVIEAPEDGAVLDFAENFDLRVRLDDDRKPQQIDMTILIDGEEVFDALMLDATHTFPVTGGAKGHNLPNGEHTIRVEGLDEWGNPASDEITIIIENAPGGSVDEGTGSDDGESGGADSAEDGDTDGDIPGSSASAGGSESGDDGCGCRTTTPPGAMLGLVVLVAIARRQRA